MEGLTASALKRSASSGRAAGVHSSSATAATAGGPETYDTFALAPGPPLQRSSAGRVLPPPSPHSRPLLMRCSLPPISSGCNLFEMHQQQTTQQQEEVTRAFVSRDMSPIFLVYDELMMMIMPTPLTWIYYKKL